MLPILVDTSLYLLCRLLLQISKNYIILCLIFKTSLSRILLTN